MLAIHISRDTLKYAQMVNFKGTPFIESLGKIDLEGLLTVPDTTNAEVTRALAEKIAAIRSSAEFPDNSTHFVIDSCWFPALVHEVDGELEEGDQEKYLDWRVREMLDAGAENYRFVHQALASKDAFGHNFFSLAIPNTLHTWIERISRPSELEVQNVSIDAQALGELLSITNLLDPEGGLQVVLENKQDRVDCWVFQNLDFAAYYQAVIGAENRLTVGLVRGDNDLVSRVANAVGRALNGEQNPDTALTTLYYFNSSGGVGRLTNLGNYPDSCKPLNLVEKFNFREPEHPNIDEYAVVVGALSNEIGAGTRED